jgi:hypothetical protein
MTVVKNGHEARDDVRFTGRDKGASSHPTTRTDLN